MCSVSSVANRSLFSVPSFFKKGVIWAQSQSGTTNQHGVRPGVQVNMQGTPMGCAGQGTGLVCRGGGDDLRYFDELDPGRVAALRAKDPERLGPGKLDGRCAVL